MQLCFLTVPVNDPHLIFSTLSTCVTVCLFVAVTECSILMQYWVGYDLDILSSLSNLSPASVSADLCLTHLLIPPAVHLNPTMKSSLEKSLFRVLTKGPKIEDPDCCGGIFSPSFHLNIFSHLSRADPLPPSPTLRCETDGGAWPLAKVNRALNCVWAPHHTPTTAWDQTPFFSQLSHWHLSVSKTVSLLLPLPCLSTVNRLQPTADLIRL